MKKAPDGFSIGYCKTMTSQVTDEFVKKFADLSGDYNPIHMDDAFAMQTRFKKRIAHGMTSALLMSRAMNEAFPGGGIYLTQSFRFKNPIYINDVLTITLTVADMKRNGSMAVVETVVKNQRNEVVSTGEALIMVSA